MPTRPPRPSRQYPSSPPPLGGDGTSGVGGVEVGGAGGSADTMGVGVGTIGAFKYRYMAV